MDSRAKTAVDAVDVAAGGEKVEGRTSSGERSDVRI